MGGAVVAVSNYAISRAQALDARQERLGGVLTELGYAIGRVDHQLRLEPTPSNTERTINETMESRAPMLHYSLGRLRRRLLEPELTEMAAALSKALSAATLAAPRRLLPVLGELTELMSQAEDPPEHWWERRNKTRSDYFVQSRRLLGSDRSHRWRLRRRS